jgi:hypothetical protein
MHGASRGFLEVLTGSRRCPRYDDKSSVRFAENLRRFVDGGLLLNLVDRVREYETGVPPPKSRP